MGKWQLQEAKAHLSEVVRQAMHGGPQEITLRGEPSVVVISKVEYDRLTHPKPSFVEFIRHSPLAGTDIDLERNRSYPRDIDL